MGKTNEPGSQNPRGWWSFRRIVTFLLSSLALVVAGLLLVPLLPLIGALWFVLPDEHFKRLFGPILTGILNLWDKAYAAFKGVVPSLPVGETLARSSQTSRTTY